MGISVHCQNPACNKSLKLKAESAGKRLKCPACGHLLLVPTNGPGNAPGNSPSDASDDAAHAPATHRPKAKSAERPRVVKAETPDDEGSAGIPWPWISTGAALLLVVAVAAWALIASSSASKAMSEADAVRAEAAASRTDKEKIEADLTKAKTDLAAMTLERKKLSGELATVSSNLEQTKASLTKSQTDGDTNKKQLALLNEELTAAKTELAKVKADAETAKETPKPSPPDTPKANAEKPIAAADQVTVLNGHSQAVVVAIKDVPGAFKLKPNEKIDVKLPLDKDYTLTILAGDRVNIVFPVKATAGIVWRIRPIIAGQDNLSVFSEAAGAPVVAQKPEPPPADPVFLVPLGPTAQQVVEEIIYQLNQHVIKLKTPTAGTATSMFHPGGELLKTMQGKKVRWQGTVVENSEPGSKLIKIRVGNLQAPGQVFVAHVYVDPAKGTQPPAVGAEVWVEGTTRKDWGGWIRLTNLENMLTVELPMPVATSKMLKAQP